MRLTAAFAAIATALLSACESPPAQNSPPEENLVNATEVDQAFPSQASGNDIITGEDTTTTSNYSEGSAGQQQGGAPGGGQSGANQPGGSQPSGQ